MMLPSFWIWFLAIFAPCFVLAAREDWIHGPQRRDDELNWTPRYRFLMEYMGRIILLAGSCALLQIAIWLAEAFR